MAWDEWEQTKADVASRQTARMRLNQLAPAAGGGGGDRPDLASSPAEKKTAAKAIHEVLTPGVTRDSKHTAVCTKAAVKEFGAKDGDGWDTSSALKKAHQTWEKQVKTLLDRLAAEKAALSKTGIDLRNNDLDIGGRLARQSRINNY
ncbi:hypothetical protein [Streptomyces sp. TRM49041]|uniref:hypothetical protein n=1 Tax=Streptomyces sp. TRM49041 TaxID=2603216 RepID=UPI0011ED42AB|nr:hypothetical protein [Streptomyces sp. TRM49041]